MVLASTVSPCHTQSYWLEFLVQVVHDQALRLSQEQVPKRLNPLDLHDKCLVYSKIQTAFGPLVVSLEWQFCHVLPIVFFWAEDYPFRE